MDNENTVYPDFVPNQVLTNRQLNQLRDYLDQQNRLGEVKLVGTGIVCGLNVTLDKLNISISNGFGVSANGYVLVLDNEKHKTTTLTHWRQYTDPDVDQQQVIAYKPWQNSRNTKQQHDILEVIAANARDAKKLTESVFVERVLVLYLEQNNVQLDSCLVTDCDSKGVNVHLVVRVLLVKKSALQQVKSCNTAKGQLIRIPRLHSILNLASIEKAEQINQAYQQIIEKTLDEVRERIEKSYQTYASILSLDITLLASLDKLSLLLEKPNQYAWDIFNDIADAYNEFIHLACELLNPCVPQQNFPRHLMLGALDGDIGYRNDFIPSAVRNVVHHDVERVRKLFLRIIMMADTIQIEKAKVLAITPSHTTLYPLGKRALPFYYNPTLEPFWQPQMCCTTEDVWSYHFQQKQEQEDAAFAYAQASFMRIEGHLGKDCAKAIKEIEQLQHTFNLEFDLLALNVVRQQDPIGDRLPTSAIEEQTRDSLPHLANDISGIEHTAGVVKGGTFILLCDDKKQVVADFSLVGKIPCCRYQIPPKPEPEPLGRISGRFTDENSGALTGGTVVLKHIGSNLQSMTTTNSKANYLFANLQAGSYTVQASINFGQNEDVVSAVKKVQLIVGENKVVNLVGKQVRNEVTGALTISVVDAATAKSLNKATVSIQHKTDSRITKTLNKPDARTKRFLFSAIQTGRYTVTAKAIGFLPKTLSVTININKLAKHTMRLVRQNIVIDRPPRIDTPIIGRPIVVPPLRTGRTERIREVRDVSVTDMQKKANTIYAQRLANYQHILLALPVTVKRSIVGQQAHTFLHETVANEAVDAIIIKQYEKLAKQGLRVLGRRNTAAANKTHYRSILSVVSLALLDSLMMSHPETLDTETTTAINTIKLMLKRAKISLTGFNKQWDAKQLKEELFVNSTTNVAALLR